MNIKNYTNKCKGLTLKKLIIKVNKKAFNKMINIKERHKTLNNDSRYINKKLKISYKYINLHDYKVDKLSTVEYRYLVDKYLKHEFDLLGSGWVNVNYNSSPLGVEEFLYTPNFKIKSFDKEDNWVKHIVPEPYIGFSKYIKKFISQKYKPIDWQLDFKSGFRYNCKEWYKAQPIGKHLGVDIKVPWELARMQHLPQIAIGAIILEDYKEDILLEFKNIVLDFLVANPLNMGCNWTCTMDVAIRISNILLAYDILKQLDKNNILDENFEYILSNAAYEHGNFIINNLEWSKDAIIGNHYFSDVVGLLFVSSYLNRTEEVDAWLVFSIQEIIECVKNQFHEDGTNFEASTSYHRLSGELMIYSTALIYGLLYTDKKEALNKYNSKLIKRLKVVEEQEYDIINKKFFPDWYMHKLFSSACFVEDLIKSNGRIPQIGDNDSGRFIKLSPTGEFITWKEVYKKYYNLNNHIKKANSSDIYWDEDILNTKPYIALVDGLFDYKDFNKFSNDYPLEKSFIESLSKGSKSKGDKIYKNIKLEFNTEKKLSITKITEINFREYGLSNIKMECVKLLNYPDFGIYIFKSKEIHLTIMAGHNGQNGNGGHAHNDKLSFELNVRGIDLFIDPGTYLYTPLPKRRDQFRSVKAHNVPIVNEEEQNTFISSFSMKNETECHILSYTNHSIKIYLTYRDIAIIREFIILKDRIYIKDSCNKEFRVNINTNIYSNGYGKLLNNL
ncbi:heparinase II/III family protein [Clostridium botulinum]|uniref:heparinase II/III domain-containing protein n=1 Tax=Clostridium botulinum TaxID=1491 RepID=UPI00174AB5FC|nr:heparinase II/III family protein [Clostridium botulinum]EKS4342885.1 heparinase II/III family protein [Clostridium botulinum]EKS4393349.1 heparinase II/III family protein [Clostridium botulinum]MBD5639090.1 heparinase II/III family protein [Clostridium botulinum]